MLDKVGYSTLRGTGVIKDLPYSTDLYRLEKVEMTTEEYEDFKDALLSDNFGGTRDSFFTMLERMLEGFHDTLYKRFPIHSERNGRESTLTLAMLWYLYDPDNPYQYITVKDN